MIIHATEGFLFSRDRTRVALVLKNRPAACVGQLVGVGGKLEAGETPLDCMRREFREEAGLDLPDWEHVMVKTRHEGVILEVCRAFGDVDAVRTLTDEHVGVYDVDNLPANTRPDTVYTLLMCLDEDLMGRRVPGIRFIPRRVLRGESNRGGVGEEGLGEGHVRQHGRGRANPAA